MSKKPAFEPGGQSDFAEDVEGLNGDLCEFKTSDSEETEPATTPRMKNRLREHLDFWTSIGTSSLVLEWITTGFPLLWNEKGPPGTWHGKNHKSALDNKSVVDKAIKDLLSKDVVRKSASIVSCPLGLVTKPGEDGVMSHRLIWDGRYVNDHLTPPSFKYEDLSKLHEVLQEDDWMIKTDMKSGFHHIDMSEESWPYLGFEWRGVKYVFTQLPFGLRPAPWAFTKVTRELLRWWRSHGIRCTGFIDDFLFGNQSREKCEAIRLRVHQEAEKAGVIFNFVKSSKKPLQRKDYLGVIVDTVAGVMLISDAKKNSLMSEIDYLLKTERPLGRTLARVTGQIGSMRWSFGRITALMTTQMQSMKNAFPSLKWHMPLTEECLDELIFWRSSFEQYNGRSRIWKKPFMHTLYSDASGKSLTSLGGWAGYFNPTGNTMVQARGLWDEIETETSSTWRELKTLFLVLKSFNKLNAFDGKSILFKTDNQGVADGVHKGTSRTPVMYDLYMEVFWYCISHNIDLQATWIPREQNAVADALSKLEDPNDWSLNPAIFSELNQKWGPFVVDLFASFNNHLLKDYYCLHHTPDCLAVDAFTQRWSGNCWCNPPFGLISKVIQHAQWCSASMCLVCPLWPSAVWWHLLLSEASPVFFAPFVYGCRLLCKSNDLYIQGLGVSRKSRRSPNWHTLALYVDFSLPLRGRVHVPRLLRGDPNM